MRNPSDEPRADGGQVDPSVDGTERCEDCGEGPVGVTMWPEMEGWSCPFCGHYNEIVREVGR